MSNELNPTNKQESASPSSLSVSVDPKRLSSLTDISTSSSFTSTLNTFSTPPPRSDQTNLNYQNQNGNQNLEFDHRNGQQIKRNINSDLLSSSSSSSSLVNQSINPISMTTSSTSPTYFPRPSTSSSISSSNNHNHNNQQSFPTSPGSNHSHSNPPPSSFVQPSPNRDSASRIIRPPSPLATSYANRMNQPQVSTPVSLIADDSPSYISARSANSLISESRPTRIQVDTLFILNRLLDELLLLILSSAKSLSTDRIKTHGVLKVLNNSALARNSVLEAELELRGYMDGKRAEGGKVPLGLMATSRWDGTENWPVASAYGMLRTRCQYYSTLGDLEDESSSSLGDQHIMSTDGRPIATITPGVAIYVTALLEFVGEYILQKVGSVIERDNSDEASLDDLVAALTEDESLAPLYNRMEIKNYVSSRTKSSQHGNRKKMSVSVKPWQVPDEADYDEAAGTGGKFNSKRSSLLSGKKNSGTAFSNSSQGFSSHERGTSVGTHNSHNTDGNDLTSFSTSGLSSPINGSSSNHTNLSSLHSSDLGHNEASNASTSPTTNNGSGSNLTRRPSTGDRNWGGQIFGGKRRGSLRLSQDAGFSGGKLKQGENAAPALNLEDEEYDDDFEAALNNPGTMKVSLTPNRLRTIEVTEKEAQAKRNSRRRPGTLSPLEIRAAEMNGNSPRASPLPSPSPTVKTARSGQRDSESLPPTPSSARAGVPARVAVSKAAAPPPSSYRSPSPVVTNQPTFASTTNQDRNGVNEDDLDDEDRELLGLPPRGKGGRRKDLSAAGVNAATAARLQPREGRNSASLANREMMELFSSTPPGTPQAAAQNAREDGGSIHSYEGTTSKANKRVSGVSGRMRNLFGRKSSASVSGNEVFSAPGSKGSGSSIIARPSDGDSGSASASGSVRDNFSNNGHAYASEDNLPSFADNSSSTSHSARLSQQQQVGGSLGRKFSPSSPPLTAIKRTSQSSQAASRDSQRPTGLNLVQSSPQDDDLPRTSVRPGSVNRMVSDQEAASMTGAPEKVVGLYEEPISSESPQNQRPASPPSPPPQSKEPPPSRKIPWTYSRQSSTGRPGSRAGATTPTSEPNRFSAGGGSSAGHDEIGAASGDRSYVTRSPGVERDESGVSGGRAAPSAWNGNARDFRDRDRDSRDKERESYEAARSVEAGEGGKTPTPAQVLGFQGPRPRTASTSLPTWSSGSRDTVKALTELDRRMRTATSVEECRAMLSKALNTALEAAGAFPNGNGNAGAMPPDSAEIQDIPDEESDANHSRRGFYGYAGRASTDRKRSDPPASSTVLANLQGRTRKASNNTNLDIVPSLPVSKAKRPILGMADNSEEEMMELESHGLVAAWLLDGGEDQYPISHRFSVREKDGLEPSASSDDDLHHTGDATLIAHHGETSGRRNFSNSGDDTSMNNSLDNDQDQDAAFASADEGERETSNSLLQPKGSPNPSPHGSSFNTNNQNNFQRFSSSSLKKSPSIENRGGRSAVSSFYSAHED